MTSHTTRRPVAQGEEQTMQVEWWAWAAFVELSDADTVAADRDQS